MINENKNEIKTETKSKTKSKTKQKEIVISFEKALIVNDGIMNNVKLYLKNMRTTQDKEDNPVNLQKTEIAIATADNIEITFSLKPISIYNRISQITDTKLKLLLEEIIYKHKEFEKAVLLNSKYLAYNILSGRWLWRNKEIANKIDIFIKQIKTENGQKVEKDFIEYKNVLLPNNIKLDENNEIIVSDENIKEKIEKLAQHLFKAFVEKENKIEFLVKANIEVFQGQQVYPSELFLEKNENEMLLKERYNTSLTKNSTDSKARMYYVSPLTQQPSITDNKIWNGIRTYDVWYELYEELKEPISIEINGMNLKYQKKLRKKTMRHILDHIINNMFKKNNNKKIPVSTEEIKDIFNKKVNFEELLYLVGCLIRGGVPVKENENK